MNPEHTLDALLRTIVKAVGRKTEEPVIFYDAVIQTITLQVDGRDQGRFIGKLGLTYWALNTIFWYAGTRTVLHPVKIELAEPVKKGTNDIPYKANDKWDRTKIKALVLMILAFCVSKDDVKGLTIEEPDFAEADIKIAISKQNQFFYMDPSFEEALDTIVRAAGRADGCAITTKITWV